MPVGYPKITVENRPVMSVVRWSRLPGVEPMTIDLVMDKADVEVLSGPGRSGPTSLIIERTGRPNVVLNGLWVIGAMPHDTPHTAVLQLVDRRHWWPNIKIVNARYNIRRQTSFYRASVNSGGNEVLDRTPPEYAFAPYSVPNKAEPAKPWTTAQIINSILNQIYFGEQRLVPGIGSIPLTAPPVQTWAQSVVLNDVDLWGSASDVLSQVMAEIPGMQISLDPNDGRTIQIYNAADVSEEDAFMEELIGSSGGDQMVDAVYPIKSNRIQETPPYIDVLFNYAMEVIFYADESPYTGGQINLNDRQMRDVVVQPEFEWPDVTGVQYETEVQNTFIDLDQYLQGCGPITTVTGGSPLTRNDLLVLMSPYMDLWGYVVNTGRLEINANWSARASAIQEGFRRLYRLPKGWTDRMLRWEDSRLMIVDRATGVRAPSVAYGDVTWLFNDRGMLRNDAFGNSMAFQMEIFGGVEPFQGIPNDAKPAARVSIVNSDLGIIHLDWASDKYRQSTVVPGVFSQPGNNVAPGYTNNYGTVGRPVAWNSATEPNNYARLRSDVRIAAIVTGIPATRKTLRIRVEPNACLGMVSQDTMNNAMSALGPGYEVAISPARAMANIGWFQSTTGSVAIEYSKVVDLVDGVPNLQGLVLNLNEDEITWGQSVDGPIVRLSTPQPDSPPQGPSGDFLAPPDVSQGANFGGASLTSIARAVAARIWSSYTPRWVGTATTPNPNYDLELAGRTSGITYTISPKGGEIMSAAFPPSVPHLDWLTLVDPGTRALLLRQVYTK